MYSEIPRRVIISRFYFPVFQGEWMKYGINLPNFGWFGDIDFLIEIAGEAEDAGWNCFCIWDHLLVFKQDDMVLPFADPWIALTAIACNTTKIRLCPLVTPLPRRRPWKVARETLTLDHLSKGRLTLGVGIGAPPDVEFEYFGENSNPKIRAELLDESLDIITGLWTGEPFSYTGTHFQLKEMTFLPKPRQTPRIPIWVGGGIPHKAPFIRAARYEGVAPVHSRWPEPVKPEDLDEVLEIVRIHRGNLRDYDIVVSGETTPFDVDKNTEILAPWKEKGVTWWLEDINGIRAEIDVLRERICAGPP